MFKSLPEDVQQALKSGKNAYAMTRVQIKLDPQLLHVVFAKKQDYEPLAIPLGYSVLDDLNRKIELKNIRQEQ